MEKVSTLNLCESLNKNILARTKVQRYYEWNNTDNAFGSFLQMKIHSDKQKNKLKQSC